jgi:hypothetical protein
MDSTVCDVEISLYSEISMTLLRLSKAHPEQIIEYVYDPSKDTTWGVAIGMTSHEDPHLESCLRAATAYAGNVALPARLLQVRAGKFICNRKFVRPGQSRDEPAPKHINPLHAAGRDKADAG